LRALRPLGKRHARRHALRCTTDPRTSAAAQ